MARARAGIALAFGIVALGVASACSLIATFDGFVGAPLTEGGADASHVDAGAKDGAAADGNAPDAHFCAMQTGAAFCADFDEGTLDAGFQQTVVDSLGTLELSTGNYFSPPASVHLSLGRRGANDIEYAQIAWIAQGVWQHTVVDFEAYLDAPSYEQGDINAALLAITFDGTNDSPALYLVSGPGYTQFSWQGQTAAIASAFPPGAWTHFHIDLQPSGVIAITVGTASSTLDAPIDGGTETSMSVTFGVIGFNAPAPAYSIYYDNVLVTFP